MSLFNLDFGGSWAYDGLVKIDSKVKAETKELVINAKELDIQKAEVFAKDGKCEWMLLAYCRRHVLIQ